MINRLTALIYIDEYNILIIVVVIIIVILILYPLIIIIMNLPFLNQYNYLFI